jgi:tetratricopeptide (TPR) repeat protein
MATIDPDRTALDARAWWEESGDLAARHCQVVALSELGATKTAALMLDEIIFSPQIDDSARQPLLMQSAALWRQLGDTDAARAAMDGAIKIAPSAALLVERASLSAEARDWAGARTDLDRALALSPRDDEALTLRASARRRLGDVDGARRDAVLAIEYRPVSASAWFELGMAEAALGQKAAARRSWLKAIDLAPGGAAAGLARGALQDMDGG